MTDPQRRFDPQPPDSDALNQALHDVSVPVELEARLLEGLTQPMQASVEIDDLLLASHTGGEKSNRWILSRRTWLSALAVGCAGTAVLGPYLWLNRPLDEQTVLNDVDRWLDAWPLKPAWSPRAAEKSRIVYPINGLSKIGQQLT